MDTNATHVYEASFGIDDEATYIRMTIGNVVLSNAVLTTLVATPAHGPGENKHHPVTTLPIGCRSAHDVVRGDAYAGLLRPRFLYAADMNLLFAELM